MSLKTPITHQALNNFELIKPSILELTGVKNTPESQNPVQK